MAHGSPTSFNRSAWRFQGEKDRIVDNEGPQVWRCPDKQTARTKQLNEYTDLLLVLLPDLQHLLVGETDPVHALEWVVVGVPEPASSRVTDGGEGLDLSGVRHVGAATKINEVATLVNSGAGTIGDLRLEDLHLERVVGKELESLLLGDDHTLELLLRFDNLGHLLLDGRVCILKHSNHRER